MASLAALAVEHLLLRLQPLHRSLRAAVDRQTSAADQQVRPGVAALCVTSTQVKTLLDAVDSLGSFAGEPAVHTEEESTREEWLRSVACDSHHILPLDRLTAHLSLTPFEEEAILLCAAPDIDRAYERIYAYILDDLNRRYPCVELVAALTAGSLPERLARQQALGRFGRLRRTGVLEMSGSQATALRQELRLAPAALRFLLGEGRNTLAVFRDLSEVRLPDSCELPESAYARTVERVASALAERTVSHVGIWGPRHAGRDEVVFTLAKAAGRPLRRLSMADLAGADPAAVLYEALLAAGAQDATLWVQLDGTSEPGRERAEEMLADALAHSPVPVLISARSAWRPSALLEAADFAEIELPPLAYPERCAMWSAVFPEIDDARVGDLATRYRLSTGEIRSVERMARIQARLAGNGQPAPLADHLDAACRSVTRRRSEQFATLVRPSRTDTDLVLPPDLHRQVLEVAAFFGVWSKVDEGWGFGRLSGGTGIKALFTGEPGTGKTLAAEVIAGKLRLPLLKVDLARVVSKWVGETEKNLESVFREAEESHSVLFFDEADALFGKRGEVQHGTDRYANLEVSYLLQKLEEHYGLLILASNLRDQIDAAFTRRFHVAIHFPRPGQPERRRIWTIALPEAAPLASDVNLDALARLDMTGSAIVSAARTAALMTADGGVAQITMAHLVQAAARQYRREARILTPSELGPYSPLLKVAL